MRHGVAQATWHTHYRRAFGAPLDEQPLMTNVLADLALESEAATVAALRLAHAFEADPNNEHEQRIKRLVTPAIKYWTCKRAPQHAAEALESRRRGLRRGIRSAALVPPEPAQRRVGRLRNVICLDVLRRSRDRPCSAYWDEVAVARAPTLASTRVPTRCAEARTSTTSNRPPARGAAALVFQAALLVRHAPVCSRRPARRGSAVTQAAFGAAPESTPRGRRPGAAGRPSRTLRGATTPGHWG